MNQNSCCLFYLAPSHLTEGLHSYKPIEIENAFKYLTNGHQQSGHPVPLVFSPDHGCQSQLSAATSFPVSVLYCILLAQEKQTSTECMPKKEHCYTKLSENIEKSQVEPPTQHCSQTIALWGLFINGTLIPSLWVLSQDPTISLGPHLLIPFIILRIRFQNTSLRTKDTIRPFCCACNCGVDSATIYFSRGLNFSFFSSWEGWGEVGGDTSCLLFSDFPQMSLFCWQAALYLVQFLVLPPPVFFHLPWGVLSQLCPPQELIKYDFLHFPQLSAFHLLTDSFIYASLPLVLLFLQLFIPLMVILLSFQMGEAVEVCGPDIF